MTTKEPDPTITGPNYASAEYAQQWRRGKRLRGEASEAVTEMMLDFAKIHVGDRVLELAAGMGDLAIMTARRVGPDGYVLLLTFLPTCWTLQPKRCGRQL